MGWFGGNNISVSDAHAASGNGAVLVDVRTSRERRDDGTPQGAVHIPPEKLQLRLASLDGKDVLVICRSGRRSAHAAALLRKQGMSAKNVKGGMLAWKRHGLPLEAPKQRSRKKKR